MRVQKAHRVTRVSSLSQSTLDSYSARQDEERSDSPLLSGITRDGKLCWIAKGCALEVFRCQSGIKVADWQFGAILKDTHTVIAAICEYNYDESPKLVVGTSSNATNMLCLFDVGSNRVVKTVEVQYKVTSLTSVTSAGPAHVPAVILCPALRFFCGIVAVGTHNGHILLLDMCLDDESCTSELHPGPLAQVDVSEKDVMTIRYNAMTSGKHLFIELEDEAHARDYYYYRSKSGKVLKTYSSDDVQVTALHFMPSTGLLAVGFNFGCYQLWRLNAPVMEYSCSYEDGFAPVTHFAYQEPENDPRNFVYMWVGRGPTLYDSCQDYCASLALTQLSYVRKSRQEGLGHLYEELTSVGMRFEHVLTVNPYSSEGEDVGSRILSCTTLVDPLFSPSESENREDSLDCGVGPDLSMCAMMWEVAPSDPHSRADVYLGLFDMNRWYQAQMPIATRVYGGGHDSCPYFAVCSLDSTLEAANPDDILALYIGYRNIHKFKSPIVPAPEQHFYPSSLSFDITCVTETKTVQSRFLGIQRQILSDVQAHGPDCLVEPNNIYNLCVHAGLVPRPLEATAHHLPAMLKRDALFSMVLEHHQVSLLLQCIAQWCDGGFTGVGCTLRSILEWAWKKVAAIKESIDSNVAQLYDWSGEPLDNQTLEKLHRYQTHISHLLQVFTALRCQAATKKGKDEIDNKLTVVSLVHDYLSSVLWFSQRGLLPEISEEEDTSTGYSYPARILCETYDRRRSEVEKLNSDLKATDVLLVDGLISECGEPVTTLWQEKGGSGLYPPGSLHALLNLYLTQDVTLQQKTSTVYYLLCDLLCQRPEELQEEFQSVLLRFQDAFSLSPARARLIQGMWLLDHKDFEPGLVYLLDPSVTKEMCPWQHRRILKTFLYQGKERMALKYIRIKKPSLVTREDVKLRLTVLLANGLTSEAFEYQRSCRDQLSAPDFLSHILQGCRETRTIDQLLHLPFSMGEEQTLVTHLKSHKDRRAQELLVLYYLQRSRYSEAIRLNNRLRQTSGNDMDPVSRSRSAVRNQIVEGYQKVLPAVQRRLTYGGNQPAARRSQIRREFVRPTPLSTVVNRVQGQQVMTRSNLVQAVLDRVTEVKDTQDAEAERAETPADEDKPGPFICTPMSERTHKRVLEVPEVVFPSTSTDDDVFARGEAAGLNSPARPSPYASPIHPQIARLAGSAGRRKSRRFTAEALTILSTPPVIRRAPGSQTSSRPPSAPGTPSTPQSILKVRSRPAINRSRSPTPCEPRPSTSSAQVTSNMPKTFAELVLPTPPRPQRLSSIGRPLSDTLDHGDGVSVTSKVSADSNMPAVGTPGTPSKQLRFQDPEPESASPPAAAPSSGGRRPLLAPVSPTRQSPALRVLSQLRSAKDRSPTPETLRRSPRKKKVETGQLPWEKSNAEDDVEMADDREDIPLPSDTIADTEPIKPLVSSSTDHEPSSTTSDMDVVSTSEPVAMEPKVSEPDCVLLDSDEDEDDDKDLSDENSDDDDEDDDSEDIEDITGEFVDSDDDDDSDVVDDLDSTPEVIEEEKKEDVMDAVVGPVPAPIMAVPVPAVVSEAPVPAVVSEAPVPVAVSAATVPAVVSEAPVPAVVSEAPVPAVVSEAPVPAVVSEAPVPAVWLAHVPAVSASVLPPVTEQAEEPHEYAKIPELEQTQDYLQYSRVFPFSKPQQPFKVKPFELDDNLSDEDAAADEIKTAIADDDKIEKGVEFEFQTPTQVPTEDDVAMETPVVDVAMETPVVDVAMETPVVDVAIDTTEAEPRSTNYKVPEFDLSDTSITEQLPLVDAKVAEQDTKVAEQDQDTADFHLELDEEVATSTEGGAGDMVAPPAGDDNKPAAEERVRDSEPPVAVTGAGDALCDTTTSTTSADKPEAPPTEEAPQQSDNQEPAAPMETIETDTENGPTQESETHASSEDTTDSATKDTTDNATKDTTGSATKDNTDSSHSKESTGKARTSSETSEAAESQLDVSMATRKSTRVSRASESSEVSAAPPAEEPKTPTRRGRKPRNVSESSELSVTQPEAVTKTPTRRGRKPRTTSETSEVSSVAQSVGTEDSVDTTSEANAESTRRRGRPRKVSEAVSELSAAAEEQMDTTLVTAEDSNDISALKPEEVKTPTRRRGRPRKVSETASEVSVAPSEDATNESVYQLEEVKTTPRRRGRPRKVSESSEASSVVSQTRTRRRGTQEVSVADLSAAEASLLEPGTPTRRSTRVRDAEVMDTSVSKSPSRAPKSPGRPRKSPGRPVKAAPAEAEEEPTEPVRKSPGRKPRLSLEPADVVSSGRKSPGRRLTIQLETVEEQPAPEGEAPVTETRKTPPRRKKAEPASAVRRSTRRSTREIKAEEVEAAEKSVTMVTTVTTPATRRLSRSSARVELTPEDTSRANDKVIEWQNAGILPPSPVSFKTPLLPKRGKVIFRAKPLTPIVYTAIITLPLTPGGGTPNSRAPGVRKRSCEVGLSGSPSQGSRSPDPLRRSPRLAAKRLAIEKSQQEDDQKFKTPTRRGRTALLPPTPPESNTNSPNNAAPVTEPPAPASASTLPAGGLVEPRVARGKSRSRETSPALSETRTATTTTRSRTSSRTTEASDSESQNGETKDDGRPLSASVIRKMRGRMSREPTPESWQTSEVGSVESEDFIPGEEMDFSFSDPMHVDGEDDEEKASLVSADAQDEVKEAVHPFVFSPPLTRGKRRESIKSAKHKLEIQAALDSAESGEESGVKKSAKKRARTPSSSIPPTDSPVSLLSPVPEDELPKSSRGAKQKVTASSRGKNLRTKRGKKREPLMW